MLFMGKGEWVPAELGVGLIGIGREWGHVKTPVLEEKQALEFLSMADGLGIRYFDTSPSYGVSEERLGKFLHALTPEQRTGITVATKFGEHWDAAAQSAYTDHSLPALRTSLEQSLIRLGSIDVLQVHKTTPEVLRSIDLQQALTHAQERGIRSFGASVSDLESARLVCESDMFSTIQLPFNQANQTFADIIELAQNKGKTVVVNRPFNMGAILYEVKQDRNGESNKVTAYCFITQRLKRHGVVLTGTKSPSHLQENFAAFQKALAVQAGTI